MIAKLIKTYLLKHNRYIKLGNCEIRLLSKGEYKTRDEWYEIFKTEALSLEHSSHKKIDITKVDCCDVCFEEFRFKQTKIMSPFIYIKANHKTIKLCKHHAKELKRELSLYEELND